MLLFDWFDLKCSQYERVAPSRTISLRFKFIVADIWQNWNFRVNALVWSSQQVRGDLRAMRVFVFVYVYLCAAGNWLTGIKVPCSMLMSDLLRTRWAVTVTSGVCAYPLDSDGTLLRSLHGPQSNIVIYNGIFASDYHVWSSHHTRWAVTVTSGVCAYPLDSVKRRMMMTAGEEVGVSL